MTVTKGFSCSLPSCTQPKKASKTLKSILKIKARGRWKSLIQNVCKNLEYQGKPRAHNDPQSLSLECKSRHVILAEDKDKHYNWKADEQPVWYWGDCIEAVDMYARVVTKTSPWAGL